MARSNRSKIIKLIKSRHADHRRRHSPSGFDFALADSVSYVNQEDWIYLTKDKSLFFSRDYLTVLEEFSPQNLHPLYAMVYQSGGPVAALCCQRVTINAGSIPRRNRSILEDKLADALGRVENQVLVCGNLMSWGNHGVAISADAPRNVWHGIAEAVYRLRRSQKLFGESSFVILKDYPPPSRSGSSRLATYSYRYVPTEPNMRILSSLEWRSFEDYLAQLKADYRKSIRKLSKEVDDANYHIQSLSIRQVIDAKHELHLLYKEVLEEQKLRLICLDVNYIPELMRAFPDNFKTLVLRAPEGEIAGFVTVFHDRDESIPYYIGFSRAHARVVPVYLRLMYAALEECINYGASSISFGRTALEPKSRLGCSPQEMGCFIRHRLPALNLLLKGLLTTVPEPEQPPERHPFKG